MVVGNAGVFINGPSFCASVGPVTPFSRSLVAACWAAEPVVGGRVPQLEH